VLPDSPTRTFSHVAQQTQPPRSSPLPSTGMSTHAAASVDCVQAADREAGRLWWSNLASLSMTPARRPPPREELVGRYPTPRLQLLLTIANLVAGRVWCRHILQSQRRRRWGWGQVEKVKLATQKGWRLSAIVRRSRLLELFLRQNHNGVESRRTHVPANNHASCQRRAAVQLVSENVNGSSRGQRC
jgi:hypothetical protein